MITAMDVCIIIGCIKKGKLSGYTVEVKANESILAGMLFGISYDEKDCLDIVKQKIEERSGLKSQLEKYEIDSFTNTMWSWHQINR